MRANDLVWNYVVNNWLLGEPPPAFDILAWNSDGTRMPGSMHEFLVRSCYLRNDFARGAMKPAGAGVNPADLTGDVYVLAAQEDHITPWRGSYLTTQVSATRYSLRAVRGRAHRRHREPAEPEGLVPDRRGLACRQRGVAVELTLNGGSWWKDWAKWIAKRGGRRVPPPPMGSDRHPPLADAPGTYVLEK